MDGRLAPKRKQGNETLQGATKEYKHKSKICKSDTDAIFNFENLSLGNVPSERAPDVYKG